ncbi:MAG: glycosyltransferase family 39 protein, partial [Sandaracinaceae bacterium]|nr:glycosyltransferase family 39 protein [Sandaracinaceae bacterium]
MHRFALALVFGAAAIFLFARLASYGIWDPWELEAADAARRAATGEAFFAGRPPLSQWLVASGFALLGVHEWSGRLPLALAGLLAGVVAYLWARRFAGRRAGLWAALIATTSPLMLFHSRQMLGQAPAFLVSAGVAWCASRAVFAPGRRGGEPSALGTALWLGGAAAFAALATLASGVLLGVVPPLLAVAAATLARRELFGPDRVRRAAAWIVVGAGVAVALGAVHAIWADYAGFGWWTGGAPRGGAPTWEIPIEQIFHSFAPWSALLPLALARMLLPPPAPPTPPLGPLRLRPPGHAPAVREANEQSLRVIVIVWAALGYAAQSLFSARFGA